MPASRGHAFICIFWMKQNIRAGRHKAWLYHALADLDAQLEGHLLFFRGRPEDILPELMLEIKADLLTMTRRYHASGARTDANIFVPAGQPKHKNRHHKR